MTTPESRSRKLAAKAHEHRGVGRGARGMTDHICCEHAKEYFDDAEQAWGVIRELERRGLVVANAVRGTQRYINGQKHHGRQINTVADGMCCGAVIIPAPVIGDDRP